MEFMKRVNGLMAAALLLTAGLSGQTLSTVTIGTQPNGPVFLVDGASYITQQVFVWPAGSKHTIQFPFSSDASGAQLSYQSALSDSIRYSFSGWTANNGTLGGGAVQVITADPSLTTVIGGVGVNYRVQINYGSASQNASAPCSPVPPADGLHGGFVLVDGVCFGDSATVFTSAGPHVLNAFPYPGWVFYGFMVNGTMPGASTSLNIAGAISIVPQFSLAKRVNFITNPVGLQILVDGSTINTPAAYSQASDGVSCPPDYTRLPVAAPQGFKPLCIGQFDFLPGSKHSIGAQAQRDQQGNSWVFSGFSNGLGQNASYVTPSNVNVADTIVANFIPGVQTSIVTNPGGMKIMVDGRDNWLANNFIWGQGEVHHLSAESPQTDAHGRVWTFTGWSDKGAQTHDITIPSSTANFAVTANYSTLAQLTINSTPPGLTFTVDGATCSTPCVVNKSTGSTTQVVAPGSVPFGGSARYDLTSWSDGGSGASRTLTLSQDSQTVTATYTTSYLLSAVSNPSGAGAFKAVPTSPDGFYASGTQVSITASANNGYRFAHWEGDLAGSFASGTLTMSSPHGVIADFATIPFIPPAGIESVTGPTPDGTVAPGSLMSIYGQNLAPGLQIGPANPLSQYIGNITVTVGDFLLPLVFVSPNQISAQVPWELADGAYTLVIHSAGQPDVAGTFTVSRNAPGIFTQANDQNLQLALALHADGTPVNVKSPASLGEQITLYATGLGPYDHPAVDGFPAATAFQIADTVVVNCGDVQASADSAAPAAGMVGVSTVKLTIVSGMPAGSNANLTIAVNGKASSQVVLPIQ
jgi:uncharacterized protein (TIGR03437 family)